MREFDAGQFDIAVIGAGHAGIEAALAAARLGLETVCLTINLDAVGNMPCNPAIGGTAKGHLVRELDALGGEMARAADRACIQYRMLNRRKGPAVWSLRAQADRRAYQQVMKHTLERQEHLTLRQAEAVALRTENGRVTGVVLRTGAVYRVRAVVLCTGTYLRGRTIVGDCVEESGPDGLHAAGPLTESLLALGLPLRRFKTGTPPRVNRRSIDFSQMQLQEGDPSPLPFSFETPAPPENRAVCWLTYTTPETHRIIRENLDKSPLYSGVIQGVGPRYCPSIETKIVRFPDKPRHQLFIEPCGLDTEGHLSTARDVAVLSRYLLNTCPELLHYTGIWTDSLRNGQTQLVNTNKLLRRYSGITGLKTGTTSGAGVCISASATRDGLTLIAVVLGSPSSADRFHSATTLLDYGFANYAAAPLPTLPERPLALAVKGSAEDSVPLDYAALPETILIEKGTASALRAELTLPEALEAPVEKGRTVGKVSIFQDDTLLNEYEVKAAADAPLLTFGGALELLWQCLLGA